MSGKTFLSFCLLILCMIFFVGNGATSCSSMEMAFSGEYSGEGVTYEGEGVDQKAAPLMTIEETEDGVSGVIAGFTFPYEEHLPMRGTVDGAEITFETSFSSEEAPDTSYRLSLQGVGLDEDDDMVADQIDFDGILETYEGDTLIETARLRFSVDRV